MSDWVTTIDAIAVDLQSFVPGLVDVTLHKYESWDPEELIVDVTRHLAVWPSAEAPPEESDEYTNSSLLINQEYDILVWESSGSEGTRLVRDEDSAATFLQLHNDTRARLLQPAQSFGGAWLSKYLGTQFPNSVSLSRWFRLRIQCRRNQALA